jgi:hypothetical protein
MAKRKIKKPVRKVVRSSTAVASRAPQKARKKLLTKKQAAAKAAKLKAESKKYVKIRPEDYRKGGIVGGGMIGGGSLLKGGKAVVKYLSKQLAKKGSVKAADTIGRKKPKMSTKRPKKSNKICPAGIAWAKRTFDKYPSAYANMAASKYCKDPNYAKKSKKK